jgi:hypothetical protein
MNKLNACISDIRKWMFKNMLKLNSEKTEVIFVGTSQQLVKCNHDIRQDQDIDGELIKPVRTVRNLGYYLDENLKGKAHVEKVCASCYATLKTIRKVRKSIDTDTCKLLMNGLILSKLDYCNSIMAGTPAYLLKRLQAIQNMACRIVFNLRKYDHISMH